MQRQKGGFLLSEAGFVTQNEEAETGRFKRESQHEALVSRAEGDPCQRRLKSDPLSGCVPVET
jgi:hypothetical protein